jgi:chromosome segregation ATPase
MDERDSGILRKQSWMGSSSNLSSARSEWGAFRTPAPGVASTAPSTLLPTLEPGKLVNNSASYSGHPQASNDVSKLQAELNLLRERSWNEQQSLYKKVAEGTNAKNTLEADLARIQRDLETVRREKESAERRQIAAETKLASLQGTHDEFVQASPRLSRVSQSLVEKDQNIDALKQLVSTMTMKKSEERAAQIDPKEFDRVRKQNLDLQAELNALRTKRSHERMELTELEGVVLEVETRARDTQIENKTLKMEKDAQRQRIEEITLHYESVVNALRKSLLTRTEGLSLQLMQHQESNFRQISMLLCFSKWRMATGRSSKIYLKDQLEAAQNAAASASQKMPEVSTVLSQTSKGKPELSALFDFKLKMAGLREAFVGIMGKKQRRSRLVAIIRFWRGRCVQLKTSSLAQLGSSIQSSLEGNDVLHNNSLKKSSKQDGIWSSFSDFEETTSKCMREVNQKIEHMKVRSSTVFVQARQVVKALDQQKQQIKKLFALDGNMTLASALKAAISAMKKQNDELGDAVATKQDSELELKEMLTSIAFYKKRFDEVQSSVSSLQLQVEQSKADAKIVEDDLREQLQKTQEKTVAQRKSMQRDLDELAATNLDLEGKLKTAVLMKAQVEREARGVSGVSEELSLEIQRQHLESQRNLNDARELCSTQKDALVAKSTEISSLQSIIKEFELANAFLKSEAAASAGLLEEANSSFTATMQKLAVEKESVELQFENFKAKCLSSEAALENVAREASRECKLLHDQLLKQQTMTYNSEQQCESLRLQSESLMRSLNETKKSGQDSISSLTVQIQEIQNQSSVYHEKMLAAEKQAAEYLVILESKEAALQRHELELGEASIGLNQMKVLNASLALEVENLTRDLALKVSLYSEASARALGEEERRAIIEVDFEACRNELHGRLHQLELKLSETQMALERKSATIEDLQQNSDSVASQLTLERQSSLQVCAELAAAKQEIGLCIMREEKSMSKISALESAAETRSLQLQTCRESIASMQATQDELNSRLELFRQDSIRKDSATESLKVELSNAEDERMNLKTLLSVTQGDLVWERQRCATLEKQLLDANGTSKELSERCNTIEDALKQTQAQYNQSQTILMETREALGEAKILASTNLSKLRTLESQHQVVQQNLERAELKQSELTAKFDGSNNALAAQRRETASVLDKLENSISKERAIQSSYDKLLQESGNAHATLQLLTEKLRDGQLVLEEASIRAAHLENREKILTAQGDKHMAENQELKDQLKTSSNNLRTAELTIRSLEMRMNSAEKEYILALSERQDTIQKYESKFLSNEQELMAVTRKMIEVAASVKISKEMLQDKEAEDDAQMLLNSSPTSVKQALKKNMDNVMQKLHGLEESRRKLQSELDILNADYNAAKKASNEREKHFSLTNDMKDSMIENLRVDIGSLQDDLKKGGIQLMDKTRELEAACQRADIADEKLIKLEKELLVKTDALENVTNTIRQSGIQFSGQISALEKELSRVQGQLEESCAKNTQSHNELLSLSLTLSNTNSVLESTLKQLAEHQKISGVMGNQIKEMSEQAEKAAERIAFLSGAKQVAEEALANSRVQNDKLSSLLSEALNRCDALTQSEAQYKTDIEALSVNSIDLNSRLDKAIKENSAIADVLKNVELTLSLQLRDEQRAKETLQVALSSLDSKYHAVINAKAITDAEKEDAMNALSTTKRELSNYQMKYSETQSRLQLCEVELADSKRQWEQASHNSRTLGEKLQALQQDVELTTVPKEDFKVAKRLCVDLQSTNDRLFGEVGALKTKMETKENELFSCQEIMKAGEFALQQQREMISKLMFDLEVVNGELAAAKQNVAAVKSTGSTVQQSLESELVSLRHENGTCKENIRAQDDRIKSLEAHKAELTGNLLDMTNQRDKLRVSMSSLEVSADGKDQSIKVRHILTDSLRMEVQHLKTALSTCRAELDKSRAEKHVCEEKILALSSNIGNQLIKEASENHTKAVMQESAMKAYSAFEDKSFEVLQLREQLDLTESRERILNESLQERIDMQNALVAKLVETELRLQQVSQGQTRSWTEIDGQHQNLISMNLKLDEAEVSILSLRTRTLELENELSSVNSELTRSTNAWIRDHHTLRTEFEVCDSARIQAILKCNDLADLVTRLEFQLMNQEKDLQITTQENRKLMPQNSVLDADKVVLQSKIRLLEESLRRTDESRRITNERELDATVAREQALREVSEFKIALKRAQDRLDQSLEESLVIRDNLSRCKRSLEVETKEKENVLAQNEFMANTLQQLEKSLKNMQHDRDELRNEVKRAFLGTESPHGSPNGKAEEVLRREVSVLDTETKDLTDSILLIRAEMRQIRKQSDEKVAKSDAEREVVQRQLELNAKNLMDANMKIATLSTAEVRANSFQKQNEELQVVFKKFERENASLEAKISSSNDQIELDKIQMSKMQAQIDQLSTNLGAAQSDIRRMEQELKQNKLQLEREYDETKKWRLRAHSAESSIENANLASSLGDQEKKDADSSVLGDRYQKTQQDHIQLKQEHSKLKTECDVMSSNVKSLERRVVESSEILQKLESENLRLKSEVDVLHAALDSTRGDLKRSTLTAELMHHQVAATSAQNTSLRSNIVENESMLLGSQSTIMHTMAEFQSLERQLMDARSYLQQQKLTIDSLESNVQLLTERNSTMSDEIGQQAARLKKAEAFAATNAAAITDAGMRQQVQLQRLYAARNAIRSNNSQIIMMLCMSFEFWIGWLKDIKLKRRAIFKMVLGMRRREKLSKQDDLGSLKSANIEMQGQIVDLKEQLLSTHKQLQFEQQQKRPPTRSEGRRGQ